MVPEEQTLPVEAAAVELGIVVYEGMAVETLGFQASVQLDRLGMAILFWASLARLHVELGVEETPQEQVLEETLGSSQDLR